MNFYSFQGMNGCLTAIIVMLVIAVLFRLFAGFIILTLPLWVAFGVIYIGKKLYENYISGKNQQFKDSDTSYDKKNDESYENTSQNGQINRDAEDVDFKEYDE